VGSSPDGLGSEAPAATLLVDSGVTTAVNIVHGESEAVPAGVPHTDRKVSENSARPLATRLELKIQGRSRKDRRERCSVTIRIR